MFSGHTWSRDESQMVFSFENKYVRNCGKGGQR